MNKQGKKLNVIFAETKKKHNFKKKKYLLILTREYYFPNINHRNF